MINQAKTRSIWALVNQSIENLPSVSAIIVSYHTGPALRDCLDALITDPQIDEIVIVNNGNPPRDLGFLNRFADRYRSRVQLISGHGNVGFARGSNLGARQATGDRMLFLNPDAILRRGSVAALEEAAENRAEPWIVGGRIFDSKGREQRGGRRRMLRLTSAMVTYTGLSLFERLHPIFADVNRLRDAPPVGPVEMPVVSGALMYMSRNGFELLDGFDEDYFLHVEDIDICRRAQETANGGVYYTPLAGALHHGGTSDAPNYKIEWQKAWGLGLYFRKFAKAHPERILACMLIPLFAILLIGRSLGRSTIGGAKRGLRSGRWKLFKPARA
ncbi:glycosyltransferase family 2 protein [Hirschia litorea]|uniref:Glycosyltransferase family 2 protein n=1 Tax=Hirschia litorea TaxID=1199156 RepID=A0ABW2IKD9_9PROT